MTGLDCLKEELRNRGYTKSQVESKITAEVLDILANANGKYNDMHKLERDISELEKEKLALKNECETYRERTLEFKKEHDDIVNEINHRVDSKLKSKIEYIDKFFKALEECETQEGRDALKKAQMYINTVDVDTKYDNTAFIIGLSAILSQGNIAPIEELQKINHDIPNIKMVSGNNIGDPGYKYGKKYRVVDKKHPDDISESIKRW